MQWKVRRGISTHVGKEEIDKHRYILNFGETNINNEYELKYNFYMHLFSIYFSIS